MPDNERDEIPWKLILCSVAAIGAVGALLVMAYVVALKFTGKSPTTIGEFGDVFGFPNAFFSGLALFGVVVAIFLQSKELSLQRQELADTRTVLKDQKEQLERQSSIMGQQAFESTFFNMLERHHRIVEAMEIEAPRDRNASVLRGRDCFEYFSRLVLDGIGSHPSRNATVESYVRFYAKYEAVVGHYFRNLYHLVKFVHTSALPNPRAYTNLVRAQLSSSELSLLFYNCLSSFGHGFQGLVEEYGLLKHLTDEHVPTQMHQFYNDIAFMSWESRTLAESLPPSREASPHSPGQNNTS